MVGLVEPKRGLNSSDFERGITVILKITNLQRGISVPERSAQGWGVQTPNQR